MTLVLINPPPLVKCHFLIIKIHNLIFFLTPLSLFAQCHFLCRLFFLMSSLDRLALNSIFGWCFMSLFFMKLKLLLLSLFFFLWTAWRQTDLDSPLFVLRTKCSSYFSTLKEGVMWSIVNALHSRSINKCQHFLYFIIHLFTCYSHYNIIIILLVIIFG